LTLQLRQYDSLLMLVLSLAIGVADLAHLIGLEEQNLAQAFVGVDALGECEKDCGVWVLPRGCLGWNKCAGHGGGFDNSQVQEILVWPCP